jgi:hypothetical protein
MTSRLRDATWLGLRSGELEAHPAGHPHAHAGGSPGHHHPAAGELGVSPSLDIGGDVGAMVVHLAGPTRTGELEAQPADRPTARFHTGVHLRPVVGGELWVAVFPDVAGGDYELLDDDGKPIASVHVTGGQVSDVDLRRR